MTPTRAQARAARTLVRRGLIVRTTASGAVAALVLTAFLVAASSDLADSEPGVPPTYTLVRPTDASPDVYEAPARKAKRAKACDCDPAPVTEPAPIPAPPAPAPIPQPPAPIPAPPPPAPPQAPTSSGAQGGILIVPPAIGSDTGVGK